MLPYYPLALVLAAVALLAAFWLLAGYGKGD